MAIAACSMGVVSALRNLDVGAVFCQRRRQRQRERNDADVGTAELGELRRLRDVLPDHQLFDDAVAISS